ncbi:PAN domain protein [Oesophagostomum dentatum]|uniref:PAN domain protein n=2 Tax=Oesophagostomum dentatum TaxID=61180 RepID=A0A0B1TVI4_OESDE|nr:PAN domain protein [Oesophagostomum dentatum]
MSATSLSVTQGCFEEIPGYMMVNVAGGLEHDVSVEECKCYCANSKTSRRYAFDCLSATYYHDERDCILNLDDRNRSPQLLERQDELNVTYIGPTCGKDETIASLANGMLDSTCKKASPSTTTTQRPATATRKRKPGANSDECFLEFNDFVLEGTALAIETTVSAQECKCRCLRGESKYGEACQSFEYYFDSNTCLINKQNRFSNPESFNFVPSAQPRSYFEHKCVTRDDVLTKYLSDYCPNESSDLQNNNVSVESTPKEREDPDKAAEEEEEEDRRTHSSSTSGALTDVKSEEVDKPFPKNKPSLIDGDAVHTEWTTTSATTAATTTPFPETIATTSFPFPKMVTMVYERKNSGPPLWNNDNRGRTDAIEEEHKRSRTAPPFTIPEAESEESPTAQKVTKNPSTTTPSPTTAKRPNVKRYVVRAYVNRNIPETDGLDEREFDKIVELELPDDYKGDPSKFVPPVDSEDVVVQWPSRLSGTTPKPSDYTAPSALVYPSVGHCTYSAMYQTAFQGTKLIRSIYVKTPADCFAACYAHGCRSANLISTGKMNTCELFRDSVIDYRSIGTIAYDGSTVYFDGIKCDGP